MAEKEKPTVAPAEPAEPSSGLKGAEKTKFDQLVRDKVAVGLPRSDAEEVARRQIEADRK